MITHTDYKWLIYVDISLPGKKPVLSPPVLIIIYFPISPLLPLFSCVFSGVSVSEALIDWTPVNLCVSNSTYGLHSAAQYEVTALILLSLL